MHVRDASVFTLTDAAKTALEQLFGDRPRPVLRVFLSFLDENGPRLDLAPDAPTAADALFSSQGWSFCLSALLLDQAGPVTVDHGPGGFHIHSGLDFSEAGGNCGGACGSHH
ncbi:hypothetical protein [Solidesulfovibrio sp.]